MDGHPITGIGQVAIQVQDTERAVAFYRDVLGLRHLFTFGPLGFVEAGGTRLMLTSVAEGEGLGTSVLYFRVDEIEGAYAALQASGAETLEGPHLIHRHDDGREEWMAFFRDSEGNTLALMAQKAPGMAG